MSHSMTAIAALIGSIYEPNEGIPEVIESYRKNVHITGSNTHITPTDLGCTFYLVGSHRCSLDVGILGQASQLQFRGPSNVISSASCSCEKKDVVIMVWQANG